MQQRLHYADISTVRSSSSTAIPYNVYDSTLNVARERKWEVVFDSLIDFFQSQNRR
jgi:hypothetical protein